MITAYVAPKEPIAGHQGCGKDDALSGTSQESISVERLSASAPMITHLSGDKAGSSGP